jgi:SWI/SNF-related matrix-associated actin-dependent regulator of chromatin subfamily A member 5
MLRNLTFAPQVDLQAQDRAHRIGQTKPVQVFRFISEGTVEEKIIERADRKLFLDAAVIQQGRLAEQNQSLEKDDLMKMVRFGADQILSGKGGTYTDEDIDALIARGEERTSAIQAKLKTDAQHNLANFTLLPEDETGIDTFEFGGRNYRDSDKRDTGNFINLPQRERKRNYDVNEYFRDAMSANAGAAKAAIVDPSKKKRKGPVVHDFQLFDKERLDEIADLERTLEIKKAESMRKIQDLRSKAKDSISVAGLTSSEMLALANKMEEQLREFRLSDEDAAEKKRLQEEGFPDWSRKDYKCFTSSLERNGRYNLPAIIKDMADECGKDETDVKKYYMQFWLHYTRIADHEKVIERINKGEQKINRLRQIRDAIQEKVERHLEETYGSFYANVKDGDKRVRKLPSVDELIQYSWPKMKINYGTTGKGRSYQEEEDAFLVCMMHRHGYGAAERIRMEIRRAWQFRFNWYFKSRSAVEIQKRCDMLVRIVERENNDVRSKEEGLHLNPIAEELAAAEQQN